MIAAVRCNDLFFCWNIFIIYELALEYRDYFINSFLYS